jgi:hypothetical protein
MHRAAPYKRTTPPKRSMFARRCWLVTRALKSPSPNMSKDIREGSMKWPPHCRYLERASRPHACYGPARGIIAAVELGRGAAKSPPARHQMASRLGDAVTAGLGRIQRIAGVGLCTKGRTLI